mmetsp:Transcript_10206/g.11762  ORF Transcript_10206/g.11762 Transcript_10206/m.11762 type:complete len:255 (+) Transcript_10206:104-868(+)|eukprot:CAMPEP_0184022130 /NCGR_PEP_ID=MMETSP0954-20121128/10402_1 /TAXON_ID=627963 /ORGANISM="Aplanochytrium sp, Strain PBS07" /LENGTH=254 /DNA_ID=CAMNT_0026304405 /DNA_START=42 /DNA_END=806 /DNA_ORIENTATION=-
MSLGPGIKEVKNLLSQHWRDLWVAASDNYTKAVVRKSEKLKTVEAREKLIKDDLWWQEELREELRSRKPPHMTKTDLVRLMEWKLARGKWRPLLKRLKAGNSEEDVVTISTNAFHLADGNGEESIKEAVKEISKLVCVGPATASAILSAYNPSKFAFMSDDPLEGIMGSRKYTLKMYLAYNKELQGHCNELGISLDIGEKALWTCATLGYTYATMNALNVAESSSSQPLSGERTIQKRRQQTESEAHLKRQKKN